MDFRRIQHFVHVAELGSLSKAANRLHIVQPALSQSIKRLEDDIGAILFVRSRRGMEPTEHGLVFLKYAYGILNQYNRAKESIATIGENPKGIVSVAMTASALHALTVPVCTRLKEEFPDIELCIEEGMAANIQQGFEAGQYDLVVSHLVKPNDTIHIENLIQEDLFLVTSYQDRSEKTEISFGELAKIPLILPQGHHGVGGEIFALAENHGFKIISAKVRGALHPTLQLIEAGFGQSILPWSAISDRIAQKKLRARRIVQPNIYHTISMAHPSHRPLTQASIAVMKIIRQSIGKIHDQGKWSGKLLIA